MAKRRRKKRSRRWIVIALLIPAVWFVMQGRFCFPKRIRPPRGQEPIEVQLETTSYCHCSKCCSYRWFLFIPYQKTGPFRYRFKQIGTTSSGATVAPGTIAADTAIYPYGTIMYIPGYGYGRVEDTGGGIRGQHIDLYRPGHWFARLWGVRMKTVKVWLPESAPPETGSHTGISSTEPRKDGE